LRTRHPELFCTPQTEPDSSLAPFQQSQSSFEVASNQKKLR
jgi:hypothetical protein